MYINKKPFYSHEQNGSQIWANCQILNIFLCILLSIKLESFLHERNKRKHSSYGFGLRRLALPFTQMGTTIARAFIVYYRVAT